jgi:hypothetical protein
MRKNTLRTIKDKGDIGYFMFSGVKFPFYDAYSSYKSRNYLIDISLLNDIKSVSKSIGKIYEDIYSENSDSEYLNARVAKVHIDTNFPGKIEVQFEINIPTDKMRDIKLDLLIS